MPVRAAGRAWVDERLGDAFVQQQLMTVSSDTGLLGAGIVMKDGTVGIKPSTFLLDYTLTTTLSCRGLQNSC